MWKFFLSFYRRKFSSKGGWMDASVLFLFLLFLLNYVNCTSVSLPCSKMYGHSLHPSLSLSIFWSPKYYNTLNKRERGEMWRHVWMCLRVFCPSGNWIEEEVLLLLFGTQFMPLVARPSIRLSRYMFCKVFSLFLHITITQTHTQKHTHTPSQTHSHTHTHTSKYIFPFGRKGFDSEMKISEYVNGKANKNEAHIRWTCMIRDILGQLMK